MPKANVNILKWQKIKGVKHKYFLILDLIDLHDNSIVLSIVEELSGETAIYINGSSKFEKDIIAFNSVRNKHHKSLEKAKSKVEHILKQKGFVFLKEELYIYE